jgi:hypothetical protein
MEGMPIAGTTKLFKCKALFLTRGPGPGAVIVAPATFFAGERNFHSVFGHIDEMPG